MGVSVTCVVGVSWFANVGVVVCLPVNSFVGVDIGGLVSGGFTVSDGEIPHADRVNPIDDAPNSLRNSRRDKCSVCFALNFDGVMVDLVKCYCHAKLQRR